MSKQKNNTENQKSWEKKKTWSRSVALGSLLLAIIASITSTLYLLNNNHQKLLTASSDVKQTPHIAEKTPQTKQKKL